MINFRHHLLAAVGLVALASWALPVRATVTQTGDVTPADNPFTIGSEGIVDYNFFQDDPDLFEQPEAIIIGETSYGYVLVTQGSQLRYQDLILGGSEQTGSMGTVITGSETGVGIFVLQGIGTLFNNDVNTVPQFIPDDMTPRGTDNYNAFIGLTGSGSLEVSSGARMEIGGAMFVGLSEGSYGNVVVDGFASHINVGGAGTVLNPMTPFAATGATLIGSIGTGNLTIRNAAGFDSRDGAAIGALDPDGGSTLEDELGGGITVEPDDQQPSGNVTVDGLGSRWRIAGGLAVGAFESVTNSYRPNSGAGSLLISNRAIVTVSEIPQGLMTEEQAGALVIGRFGQVEFASDGQLIVEEDIFSHGNIVGDGILSGTTFLNRNASGGGQVIVSDDEKLTIRSFGEDALIVGTEMYFGANTGLIEVANGEFEFDRILDLTNDDNRFKNLFIPEVADDPATTTVNEFMPEENGTINVRNGTVRFRSGLLNTNVMGFTGGNNLLSADVINDVGGLIVFSGDSNTTIDNNFLNNGQFIVTQDSTLTVLGDITLSAFASLNLTLSNAEPVSNLQQGYIAGAGDIALGGLLDVDAPAFGDFDPMPGDSFLLLRTAGAITGAFNALDFTDILPLSNPGWNWILENTGQELFITVTDIMPIGADFNGDSIVDAADIAIWQMNFGLQMGATGLQGDADGDGDVDGIDFFIISEQLGGPGMGSLTAPDLGNGNVTVPEPATLWLLASGATLLVYRRRLTSLQS